jgi:glycosyltransferase involved in cell wall biosynthesis
MNQNLKDLFIVVSDYPFGIGEPFLETELIILSTHFKVIYLIIPETKKVNFSITRFELPENCKLIKLNSSLKLKFKLKAIITFPFIKSNLEELRNIKINYNQQITLNHFKIMLGFKGMAYSFKSELKKYLNRNKINFNNATFYSYWLTYATFGLALLKNEKNRINVITRVHGWDCFFYRNKLNYLPYRPFIIEQINSVCTISKTGNKYLIEKTQTPFKDKVKTHYLGINEFNLNQNVMSKNNKIHLVSIAFIDPVKRLDKIADALIQIKDFKIQWTHIGNEPNNDNSFQKSIENQFENSENVNINFLGELTKKEIFNFLKIEQIDFLICTSDSEGIPVSMMEALAHGIPIISLDVGGVSEIVIDNFNGYLLNKNSSNKDIANKIIEFHLLNEDKRKELHENAREHYLNHFSAEKNYFRFLKEELLHE